MELTALCMVAASLTLVPNRSQFFNYESVSLSCEGQGNSSGWRVMRKTWLTAKKSECLIDWGQRKDSHCFIDDIYPLDTGVYWCESGSGQCSDPVNITVTGGSVILESPVLPVTEGSNVTLRCKTKTTPSNLNADFYKDGLLIRTGSAGEMTIHSVSKSDEGLYKCNMSGTGVSADSWMAVRASVKPVADPPPAPPLSVRRLVCHVVVGTPYLLSTIILGLIFRDRARAARVSEEDRSHVVDMVVE